MRGISLPVMSQLDKLCLFARAYNGVNPHTTTNLNLDWLDHMWWSDDVDNQSWESEWVREREIESETNRGSERGESENETVREVENFGSWRYAVCRHVQLRIVYMLPSFDSLLYHYTIIPLIPPYHYTTTYPHPLPKPRPAIILHRSSDNIFNNLCT